MKYTTIIDARYTSGLVIPRDRIENIAASERLEPPRERSIAPILRADIRLAIGLGSEVILEV